MGNKNSSSSVKLKSRTFPHHHEQTECQQQQHNGHPNAVRNEPISGERDAILSSAASKQIVLPKIALVTSITAETLFAGDVSVIEDESSYKDAENENLFLASECSDSVNAPELPLDSNTADSFYLRELLDIENATTCSLSSYLDQPTSDCLSNGDTWTGFYAMTDEIGPEEIKLLQNRKKQKLDDCFSGKATRNGRRNSRGNPLSCVELEYLNLEIVRRQSVITKTLSCGLFSKLYSGNGKSLSTTIFDANLYNNMPLKNVQLTKQEKGQNNLKYSRAKSQPDHQLNLSESFSGHEIISKLLSSIDDDHYLKLLISHNDLKLLMSHVVNYLLSIGAICSVESTGKHEKFKMDNAYKWASPHQPNEPTRQNYNNSHFINIEEHLSILERLRKKSDNERKLLENECRQKLRELENVIASLSKEINSLKSYLGQDTYPVVISPSDLWL